MQPGRAPDLVPPRLDRAFELVAGQVRSGLAGYAALAVGRAEGLVRSEAFGPDGALDAPRRSSIASLTKPVTATAVMQLVERGEVVLLEPVAAWLPAFAPQPPEPAGEEAEAITSWHILTHTAGLADAPDAFFLSAPPTRAAMLDRLSTDRLRFPPGTAYAYASDSFHLLAELIERRAGLPYPDDLATRIFEPLGMTATGFDPGSPGPEALGLEGVLGPPGVSAAERQAYFVALAMPGGGLWSTPEDMVRFGRCMLQGGTLDGVRLLGRPFVDLMLRCHTDHVRELGTGRSPNYALGWGRPGLGRASPASTAAFGHGGATGSALLVDPRNDLVIVYLRNEWGAPTEPTDAAIQAVYAALEG